MEPLTERSGVMRIIEANDVNHDVDAYAIWQLEDGRYVDVTCLIDSVVFRIGFACISNVDGFRFVPSGDEIVLKRNANLSAIRDPDQMLALLLEALL